jgi:hypothetical protein
VNLKALPTIEAADLLASRVFAQPIPEEEEEEEVG